MRPSSKQVTHLAIATTALALAASGLTGCAYRAGYGDRQIPGGYQAIAVPVFKNRTHDVGVEVPFTNAMVREIERSKIGRVAEKSQAQVTLEGSIDKIDYIPGSQVTSPTYGLPDGTILNSEYRIFTTVSMKLIRNSDQKVLWQASFAGERQYYTPRIGLPVLNSANALYNNSARYQNIQEIAFDLMSQAHDRLTENF